MSVVDAKKSKLISSADVEAVIRESKALPRKRVPILVHDSYDEMPQRFVNCMSANSYIRPHLHENNNQWELVIWVSGEMLVLIFNEDGSISKESSLARTKIGSLKFGRTNTMPLFPCRTVPILRLETVNLTLIVIDGMRPGLRMRPVQAWMISSLG